MKKFTRIALRILGLGLVILVLWQIQYRDRLSWTDGREESGQLIKVEPNQIVFLISGQKTAQVFAIRHPTGPQVHRGVVTIFKQANLSLFFWATLLFCPVAFISVIRWRILLTAIGLPTSLGEIVRLTLIGFFFNTAMPGLTGGDLVKAFYIARGSRSPYTAFLSVFVDRAIGLFGLVILAGAVMAWHLGEPGFGEIAKWIFASLALGTLLGLAMFSRRLRRWLQVDLWLGRLPLGKIFTKIDQAILAYRNAPKTVVISIVLSILSHTGTIFMTMLLGRAVGIENPITHFFVITPICFLIASVPLLPGGWGMREGAFAYFFAFVGVPAESAVACSVLLGLSQQFWYFLGGPVFIARPDRVSKDALDKFGAQIAGG